MRLSRLGTTTMAAIFIGSLVAWSSAYSCGKPTKGDSGNKIMPAARKGEFKKISPHGSCESKNESSRKTSILDTKVAISDSADNDADVKNAVLISKNDTVYGIVKYERSGISKDHKRDYTARKSKVEFTGINKADIKSVSLNYSGGKLQFNVTKNDGSVVTFDVSRKNKHTPTGTDSGNNDDPSPPSASMPTLPATITADSTRTAKITFSSGTLLPSSINDLWAEVKYDGKTEYWDLDPALLSADGKSMSIQFDSSFEGKTVAVKIYALDKQDVQTSYSNSTNITIPADQQPVVNMPTLPATITADSTRTAKITFSSGTLLPSSINDLWAEVKYDGKTEYWDLDPALLAADGKSMSIQFDSSFEGKTVAVKIYALDKQDVQTSYSNSTNITIPADQQPVVTMPSLPAAITADSTRTAKITFSSGTLLPSSINDLWAEVKYDGKTEYWDLDPALLAADGKSMSIQFDSAFEGKTVAVKIYALDKQDVQTSYSNSTNITIPAEQQPVVNMPSLPAAITADSTRTAKITFSSGTLLPSAINDLWAEVKYDGKTEYWDLDPALLAADGKSMSIQFDSSFAGKTVAVKIYAFDKQNVQTSFSNSTNITIPQAVIPSVTMPTLPSSITTDNTGLAKITFTSGTLLPTSINDLWAEVKYDGKTEYWDFNPEMLSADGTYMTVQFDPLFNGKTVIMRIYGFDTGDKQTSLSNPISILVDF